MAYCPVTGDWRHILDTIQDMVVVLDLRQQVLWANRSFLTFLALPEEDVIGRPCHRLLHAGTSPGDECPCVRMVKRRQRESFDMDLPDRDMRVRITVDPLRDGDGNLAGSIHILSDVTATRRAELRAQFESRRLMLLTRIGASLLGDFDIKSVLTETALDLGRFLGVPRCAIFLSGSPGGTVEYHEPDSPSAIDAFRELSNAAESREAFESGRSLVVNDIRLWPYPEGKEGAETILPRAFLGVPLCDQEKLFGVLFLDRPEPHEWTENEIETAEAVARQVALAVRQTGALREQQQLAGQLLSLMNNVPGTVYRGLRDWSLTFVGAEVVRLTGYTAEEFLQGFAGWQEIVHPDDLPSLKVAFRSAVREQRKVLRVEYRIRHRDGGYRWLADRRQLIYGLDGSFDHVDGLLLDISEPKRVEEELRASNQALETLIEASPLAIMALDRGGYVTLWNPASEKMFGWTKEESIGRLNPIVPEEKIAEFRGLREQVLREGGFSRLELQRQKKGGIPIEISLSTAPVRDAQGNITGIMSVIEDITEHKRIEEALRQSEEQFRQAQKMEAVGRLAGGVAHDFNNLLTAIRGYSDMLLLRLDACSPHRKEVEEIHKAGERASALTQQLLAFSRKQVLQPKVLDLNEVVAGMEEMLGRMIGENVDLIAVLRPDLWSVKVDKGQIEQMVMNLVVNARDAIDGRGKITVETGNVYLDDEYVSLHSVVTPGAYVMLAVSDTGNGMDGETKARLFEPFFTTKEKGKGTGLGLSTVYGIVKQSDGYIWVYSEPNQGSVFKIYFPRHESPSAVEDPARSPVVSPRGHETILLVEDEVLVRVLVRDVLTGHGYNVLEANDGADAMGVAVSHRGPIHMMIADVVMPNMGGPEVAVSLAPLLRDMKVLFMSGYTGETIAQRGILRPGTCFLQKPFRLDALLRKVREVLDG
ncbi:MAG TPA: PAS domain S-box protein [Candidatus Limnocylindria bacterium]|nr:PAS domain S-box protein [Candidatus Limnocylindria bacterium]